MDSSLTSPAVNLSGQSAPAVRFTSGYYGGRGQQGEIDLSTDNGRTWSRVWHQGAGDAVGPVSVPIPRAAGKSRVRVRFRYAGDDAWWWSVGDVLIGTPGCAALKGGLVTGLVTQRGSGRPVDGATVTASGSAAGAAPGIAAATGDPALSGGLYQVFSPAGRHSFTASAGGYAAASATVPVTAGRLTRRDWALTAKSAAARHAAPLSLPAATTAASPPGAAPARLVTLPGLRGRSYTVTLITGDQVRLTAARGGRYSVTTVPSPAASPELSVSAVADRGGISTFQAMPSDAAGLIFGGRLDRGLFDLSWLIRHGDTGPGATLPLVLRYGGHSAHSAHSAHLSASALVSAARALPGASVTGVSPGTGTVRVRVAAGKAARFWAAITGRAAARSGALEATLAGGLTRVWLAGHQEGAAPAARPADGQLYTVTETIDGPASKSRWCGNGQSLCVLPDFSLFGTSGDGTGQGFQPSGVTCAAGTSPCLVVPGHLQRPGRDLHGLGLRPVLPGQRAAGAGPDRPAGDGGGRHRLHRQRERRAAAHGGHAAGQLPGGAGAGGLPDAAGRHVRGELLVHHLRLAAGLGDPQPAGDRGRVRLLQQLDQVLADAGDERGGPAAAGAAAVLPELRLVAGRSVRAVPRDAHAAGGQRGHRHQGAVQHRSTSAASWR